MNTDQIAAEALDKLDNYHKDFRIPRLAIIQSAIEKALKAQADETKACIEMVGGLGAAHASERKPCPCSSTKYLHYQDEHQPAHASEQGAREWTVTVDSGGHISSIGFVPIFQRRGTILVREVLKPEHTSEQANEPISQTK